MNVVALNSDIVCKLCDLALGDPDDRASVADLRLVAKSVLATIGKEPQHVEVSDPNWGFVGGYRFTNKQDGLGNNVLFDVDFMSDRTPSDARPTRVASCMLGYTRALRAALFDCGTRRDSLAYRVGSMLDRPPERALVKADAELSSMKSKLESANYIAGYREEIIAERDTEIRRLKAEVQRLGDQSTRVDAEWRSRVSEYEDHIFKLQDKLAAVKRPTGAKAPTKKTQRAKKKAKP